MNELETKVVAALKSGNYTQITDRLTDGVSYCPLGIACIVAGLTPELRTLNDGSTVGWFDGDCGLLPASVQERLGWGSNSGWLVNPVRVGSTVCRTLVTMNDAGASYEWCAAQIEHGNILRHVQ